MYDSEFASSCLAARLHDDEPAVVAAVLELGGKVGLGVCEWAMFLPPSLSPSLSLSLLPHMQTLARHVPAELLLPPLSSILTRPNLHLEPLPWQTVATSALSLLTTPPLSKTIPSEQLDDIIVAALPLLFVHRRGNKLAGGVAYALCEADHVLVGCLRDLMEDKGEWIIN